MENILEDYGVIEFYEITNESGIKFIEPKGESNMEIKFKTIYLCKNCIDAIKSRGEKVFVGDEAFEEPDGSMKCEWCEEEGMTLYECLF